MSQIPLNMDMIQDIILLFISGLACIYCIKLNRKLKGLSNLKSGVGASIVSLTEAIHKTHHAAQKAQASTEDSVKMLKQLIEKAETLSTQLEATTIDAERRLKSARSLDATLEEKITVTLPNSVMKAQNTASSLLKVVSDIESYRNGLTAKPAPKVVSIEAPHMALEQDNETPAAETKPSKSDPVSSDSDVNDLTPEMAKSSMEELFDEMEVLAEKAGLKKTGLLSRLKQARS
ncbi:hypothetical protein [Litorimonas sp.]|uniref:hypothetical protein n=1 Tax=Litorimonas sp. TaxID=1892381 RepID=UPI003A89D650